MIIIKTDRVRWFRASAITVWPFIFIRPVYAKNTRLLRHERRHGAQQRRWAFCCLLIGWPAGALLWYALYLLCLPVGWNWWRYRWEMEAMLEEGLTKEQAHGVLTAERGIYRLWWM